MGNIFIKSCENTPNIDNNFYCRSKQIKDKSGYCVGNSTVIFDNMHEQDGRIKYTKWENNIGTICQDDYIAVNCKHARDTRNNPEGITGCECIPNTKENNPNMAGVPGPTCGTLKPIPVAILVGLIVGIIYFVMSQSQSNNTNNIEESEL